MDFIEIKVNNNLKGKSIREILLFFHLAKEKIYAYSLDNAFMINDNLVNQFSRVEEGDVIKIKINENINVSPIPSSLDVVYEDDYYLIVNKPRGLLVHSDGVSKEITLSNMVANYYKMKHIRREVRCNNRLDKETEGLVAFSKDPISHAYLNDLIENRKVEKKYYALCYNKFSKASGMIDLPIGRNKHDAKKMIVFAKGKDALTEYKVLRNKNISLVDITLHTGRTHQIRVHLSYLNHPLLGDRLYGKEDNYSLMLQSYKFSFYNMLENKNVDAIMELSTSMQEVIKNGK